MRALRVLAALVIALSSAGQAAPARVAKDDWRPVNPADLARSVPVVEEGADAEAVFWEVRISDNHAGGQFRVEYSNYIRIKVFTERGVAEQGRIEIPYLDGSSVEDIAARTIRPDGSTVELRPDQVFDRTVVRAQALRLKSKSFAVPGVTPGALIEYRWREVRRDQITLFERLPFQREIPVRLVTYYIKPIRNPVLPLAMRTLMMHASDTELKPDRDGYYTASMTNVPAFRPEPQMPPEDQVRPWMLAYYSDEDPLEPDEYWLEFGKARYEEFKAAGKLTDDVRRAAEAAAAGAMDDEARLARLYTLVQSKVANVEDDASAVPAAALEKWTGNDSPSETLRRGFGSRADVELVFAALAAAAGFDARIAMVGRRDDLFFDQRIPLGYFLVDTVVAVSLGGRWRFFDPADSRAPFGQLPWHAEGQRALVTDPKAPFWVTTPITPAASSKVSRSATLALSADGALEGELRVEMTGQLAREAREVLGEKSGEEREDAVRDEVVSRLPGAEVSGFRIDAVDDPSRPLAYTARVRVAGFAQRTGKRLFVQPAFFQAGVKPRFSAPKRRYPIYFHFPWSEDDTVTIRYPAGFTPESPGGPKTVNVGALAAYRTWVETDVQGRALVARRTLTFGGEGSILFPVKAYDDLKRLFEVFAAADARSVTLREAAAPGRP